MQKRYEDMLFNYETTVRTDFRDGEIRPIIKTEYKEKRRRPRPPYEPVKYVYTLKEWRKTLPFSTNIKLRDILQTNPHDVQKPYEKPPDLEREQVQKTRPRLTMTPAVSMDDVESATSREILVRDMYTSDMTAKSREAITPYFNVKSPLPGRPAPANPISLAKWKPPCVPKEWRMESASWDRRQVRSYVHPSRQFWLQPEHAPTRCHACEQTAVAAAQRKMLGDMKLF